MSDAIKLPVRVVPNTNSYSLWDDDGINCGRYIAKSKADQIAKSLNNYPKALELLKSIHDRGYSIQDDARIKKLLEDQPS